MALGIKKGDIVLCQSLTFVATANPILYLEAIPVFIDSDFETWNLSPVQLENAFLKYGSAIKAVIVVHLFGLSADMDKIIRICKRYNVPIIEDAAESLGSFYKGKHTGTIGSLGIFSFNGNKIITTSSGGMLVSNNENLISKARFWSTQSRDNERYYQHSEIGFNYGLSNILAGIGLGQLVVLEQRKRKKKYIFDFYKAELASCDKIHFMPINDWNDSNYWLTVITLNPPLKPLDILLELERSNIESRLMWKPMHMQPLFIGYDYFTNGVSENLFETGLCLPSDTKMTDQDIKKVCNIIKGFFNVID